MAETKIVTNRLDTPQNINIAVNGGFELWNLGTSFVNPTSTQQLADKWKIVLNGSPVQTISRETSAANVDSGSYSMKWVLSSLGGASTEYIQQDFANYMDYAGKTLTLTMRVKTTTAGFFIGMSDGLTFTQSPTGHTGSGNFETLSVTATMSATPLGLGAAMGWALSTPVVGTYYIDSAMFTIGSTGNTFVPANPELETVKSVGATNLPFGIGRNRIINGEMAIDQQNGGNAITINSGATFKSVDGISTDQIGSPGVYTMQRLSATPPTGFQFYVRTQTTTIDASLAAGDYYRWYYIIEGKVMRDFGWGAAGARTVTMSFWARSSLTGTFSLGLINGNGGNRAFTANYVINSANTWEYKTIVVPGDITGSYPTDTSAGLYIFMNLGSGTTYKLTPGTWTAGQAWSTTGDISLISTLNATLDITGVQLELGSATSFEYKNPELELAICQRYYEKSYDFDVNPGTNTNNGLNHHWGSTGGDNTMKGSIQFKIPKRIAPSVIFYRANGTSGSWDYERNGVASTTTPTLQATSFNSLIYSTGSLGATWVVSNTYGHWIADSRL